MFETVYAIFVVLILFGLTIFVHELGHFLVARWCGLTVDTFSIGFGPAIVSWERGGVVYKIGWLPFGGYVALPQMDPTGASTKDEAGNDRKLAPVSPGKKIAVALAGVVGNMILAVLLGYVVYWVGKPSEPHETGTVVGYVAPQSAAVGGMKPGDAIRSVNGKEVHNWNDIFTESTLGSGPAVVVYQSGETMRTQRVETVHVAGAQLLDGISWETFCTVGKAMPGSSAAAAGLKSGDRIYDFDGERVFSQAHLVDLVNKKRDVAVPTTILREGERLVVTLKPTWDEGAGRALIGIEFMPMALDFKETVHPTPWQQIRRHSGAIFRFLQALVTPHEAKAAAKAVSGPIGIFMVFWWAVKSSFIIALWFTVFFNVNLAILNLLPLPVLDGGHLVFAAWEAITRKPVSARVMTWLWNVFVFLLLAVFILISFRDTMRLFPFFSGHKAPIEEQAASTNAVSGETP